jgi:hypothetical protein
VALYYAHSGETYKVCPAASPPANLIGLFQAYKKDAPLSKGIYYIRSFTQTLICYYLKPASQKCFIYFFSGYFPAPAVYVYAVRNC